MLCLYFVECNFCQASDTIHRELLISSKSYSLFRSKLVNFQVGPQGTNFTVHAESFGRLSGTLNTLINGDMVEAKTGVIDWRDIDEETFLRFCEFAYIQDYTPPRYSDNNEEPKQVEKQDLEKNENVKKKGQLTSKPLIFGQRPKEWLNEVIKVHNPLSEGDYPVPSCILSFRRQFKPVPNTSPHRDLAPVLLGHARLYLLANKYDVQALENLVLHKLCLTLKESEMHEAQITGVMELVRFAYDNTPNYQYEASAISQSEANLDSPVDSNFGSDDNGHGPNVINDKEKRVDSLRKLVTRIVVSKLDVIKESLAFLSLLHDKGEFVVDFWIMLRDILRHACA
jgi:hypothetical protein